MHNRNRKPAHPDESWASFTALCADGKPGLPRNIQGDEPRSYEGATCARRCGPLVLCDKPMHVRRNTALEICASDYGYKQQCTGRTFNWLRNILEVEAELKCVPVEEADRYEFNKALRVSGRVTTVEACCTTSRIRSICLSCSWWCLYQPTLSFPQYRRRIGGCRRRETGIPR